MVETNQNETLTLTLHPTADSERTKHNPEESAAYREGWRAGRFGIHPVDPFASDDYRRGYRVGLHIREEIYATPLDR